jgi:dihydrofolate reductase
MRQLVLKMSVSVDGFVSGPNGEVDWIFGTADGATEWLLETLWRAGLHAMGSRAFHDMAAFWPSSAAPLAAPMNEIPKVVFSRTGLGDTPRARATTTAMVDARRAQMGDTGASEPAAVRDSWANPIVATGDLSEAVARLKAAPGKDILAHGGVRFARDLAARGLIDEYRLLVHPVALGAGLALFSGLARPLDLRLVGATTFSGGATAMVYRPA